MLQIESAAPEGFEPSTSCSLRPFGVEGRHSIQAELRGLETAFWENAGEKNSAKELNSKEVNKPKRRSKRFYMSPGFKKLWNVVRHPVVTYKVLSNKRLEKFESLKEGIQKLDREFRVQENPNLAVPFESYEQNYSKLDKRLNAMELKVAKAIAVVNANRSEDFAKYRPDYRQIRLDLKGKAESTAQNHARHFEAHSKKHPYHLSYARLLVLEKTLANLNDHILKQVQEENWEKAGKK